MTDQASYSNVNSLPLLCQKFILEFGGSEYYIGSKLKGFLPSPKKYNNVNDIENSQAI